MNFVAPWLLAFLVALPVIWWLLRLTPPAPKQVTFPALDLLRGLVNARQTPARTPWWLLALRLSIAALVIVGLAKPLLSPHNALSGSGPLLIAIDNDWASARAWEQRQQSLRNLIAQAEREHRDIMLLPTAPNANGAALEIDGPFAASSATAAASRIAPQPWPSDWSAATALLKPLPQNLAIVWLNGGLGGTAAERFAATLKGHGTLRILSDAENTPLYLLTPPNLEGDAMLLMLHRALPIGADTVSVAALDAAGKILAQIPARFPSGTVRAEPLLDLPRDVRNHVTRLEVEGSASAATTILLDERWHRRPVGLVSDTNDDARQSLLDEHYYLERALKPFVDLRRGAFRALMAEPLAVLILTDNAAFNDEDEAALEKWVRQGGVLIRFAGPQLGAGEAQKLLPVTLRHGDRALGGALSWATPQRLLAFPSSSPFHGLALPDDVTISRQLLADPEADLSRKSWASLQDGTPLVTAKAIGLGHSVLFHVPALPDWSNLPLSGLFVEMLRRLIDLGNGMAVAESAALALPPRQVMDAFGVLKTPPSVAQSLTDLEHAQPSPQHPPGLYGPPRAASAFNLGQSLSPPIAYQGDAEAYKATQAENDLQPIILTLAFLLALLDFMLSLWLRGMFKKVQA